MIIACTRFLPYVGMVTILMNDYPMLKVGHYWSMSHVPCSSCDVYIATLVVFFVAVAIILPYVNIRGYILT